jgi:hypothetical protein
MTLFERLFKNKTKSANIVLVGEPNTGKSTLANKFAVDFTGETMSKISEIPHETTEITTLEKVDFQVGNKRIDVTLCDTPGIAQSVDYREFMKHGLSQDEAIQRAKDATGGIVSTIKFLKDVDVALVVMDACLPPFDQVSLTILGTLEMHKTKTIIVANKTDLDNSNPDLIRSTFPHIPVIGISALTGEGIDDLYSKIASVA